MQDGSLPLISGHTLLSEGQRLLQRLVETPSPSGQELAAAKMLVEWLIAHDCASFVDEAGNAVGIVDGGPAADGSGPREIVLLGHIDTVPGAPPVIVREGRLYGRGAVDAKGPLAAFATAVALAGPQPGWRFVVVGAVEEEAATSIGARHVLRSRPRPDLAIIGEPSGWQRITLGYKGRLLCDATVRQALAHRSGGTATACEVAVDFWNRATAAIAALNAGRERAWDQVLPALRAFHSHEDGLRETARLGLGFRLPSHLGPDALKSVLRAAGGSTVELNFSGEEVAYQAGKNNALVRRFLAAIRDQGGSPGFLLKTGTSDMNVVGPVWACPIVAYGPGDSRLDHTPDEHINLGEWQQGAVVLASVLRGLAHS